MFKLLNSGLWVRIRVCRRGQIWWSPCSVSSRHRRRIRIIVGWLVSARVSESLGKWVAIDLEPRYLLILIGGNCDELCLPENKCRNAWLVDIDALVSDKGWWISLIENLHKKSDFLIMKNFTSMTWTRGWYLCIEWRIMCPWVSFSWFVSLSLSKETTWRIQFSPVAGDSGWT